MTRKDHLDALRKEAREHWEHVACDEVVYFLKRRKRYGLSGSGEVYFQSYRQGRSWLEFFFRLSGGGIDGEYAAICEADLDRLVRTNGQVHHSGDSGGMNRELMMLVGVTEFGEKPEAIPSVIRLQPFDLLDRIWMDVPSLFGELSGVLSSHDGKRSASIGHPLDLGVTQILDGQSVRDVVKRTVQAVDRIPERQGPDRDWRRLPGLVAQFARDFRIVLTPTGFIIGLVEGAHIRLDQLQVSVRPIELQCSAIEWRTRSDHG